MGEAQRRKNIAVKELLSPVGSECFVETPSGKVHVHWDSKSSVTPFGQMAYFIEFLNMTGLFSGWVDSCPLEYTSPNAPDKLDFLGTWLLSILSGHKRYAHVTSIKGDGVNPELLGMKKILSEDSLRRGLSKIPEGAGICWLQEHLEHSVLPLLKAPWILDVDTTVKPLYGKQEGAVVGYNPTKPGRPSHTYHTYLVAGLRLVLDAEVHAGNQSHSNHTLPGLLHLLDKLPENQRPYIVRGDAGFGTDRVITELENRNQNYLFKLRLTKKVKQYIEKSFYRQGWSDAGSGWEGLDGEIQLGGWDRKRHVVMLRRQIHGEIILQDSKQDFFGFIEGTGAAKRYEYAVLVTNLEDEISTIAQLYRDRADAENNFDELKNHWGWGGFTTQDLHRCQLSVRAVALIYNWWSLFVRLANPKIRHEAITSRPLLLTAIAEKTQHARKTDLTITPMHGKGAKAKSMLEAVSNLLKRLKISAEQLNLTSVWEAVCNHLILILTNFDWKVARIFHAKNAAAG